MSYTQPDRQVRLRSLTERGRLYELGENQRRRGQLDNRIRTQLIRMELSIEDNRFEGLINEFDVVDKLFSEYMKCHAKCQILIQSGVDDVDNYSTASIDRKVTFIKRKMAEVLDESGDLLHKASNDKEATKVEHTSRRSVKSGSTRMSSSKSILSQMAKERAKLAELQVEAEFMERQQKLEQQSKSLSLKLELAKTEAKIKAYQCIEDDKQSQILPKSLFDEVDKSKLVAAYVNAHHTEVQDEIKGETREKSPDRDVNRYDQLDNLRSRLLKKAEVNFELNDEFLQLIPTDRMTDDHEVRGHVPKFEGKVSHDLTTLVNHLQAPSVEIDTFSGNCIDYPYFITTFSEVVETRIPDSRGRLTRLLKYLKDEAKELVESCVYLPPDKGYEKARQLLEKNYGDQYRIMSEYRKELKSWPKLKAYDGKGFRKFYSFLMKYKSTMMSLRNCQRYDSPELLQRLQLVLPSNLQEGWNRKSYHIRKKQQVEAGFDNFIDFMEEEMMLVNDPNFSKNALFELKEDSSHSNQKRFVKTLLTSSKGKPKPCPKCTRLHDLDECREFLMLKPFDRQKFVFRNRLCFSCYEPTSKDHIAVSCPKKRKCDVCDEPHPTGLHGCRHKDKPPDENKPIGVNYSKLKIEVISLNVVPVKITHPLSSVEIITKALLDNGSQGTFVHENILEELNVPTIQTTISIKTMTGETTERCKSINNLQVSAVEDSSKRLNLPRVFSRKFLPVDKEEIPTPNKVAKWSYLNEIHKNLQQDEDETDIGILIGANCPRALEPIEIIPSQGNGPYAFRSVLGWCVTGPIISKGSRNSSKRCNYVSISDDNVPTRFVLQDNVKEHGLAEMMLMMFRQDFSENTLAGEPEKLSLQDRKFLKLMDENVKLVDGHYQLPLPFKDPMCEVPNNKSQAIKRAHSLKRKLQQNQRMHDDYCTFMKTILDKGFAQRADRSCEKGRTWYLPHHGVYHPRKPNKIRVVFDCSATYGGVSLNSLLLQGPDLANQIVGVLTRFREEQVAVAGDIESMFYQVKVPDNQRDMLRFVWWPEGNLDAELQEYQMCVHVFGGTHSPSTCNYALRKTAHDNIDKYGEEAALTLIRNFYVDDMLKSSSNALSTLHLIEKVKKMCAAGGFPLTKFVSSSRKVLEGIPTEERSKDVKDLNFDAQTLPIERALGVSWCVETDSFCFRIVLKDNPLTRRGILSSISSVYDPLGFGAPFLLPAKQLLQQLCSERKDWDDDISQQQRAIWEQWRNSLPLLKDISIRRCIVPECFGKVCDVSLHHFSDASTSGYGQVSYLRLVNDQGEVHCCFMMGKARVTPLKPITVPRLELSAANTSTKVATQLKRELNINLSSEVFWTDSKVVLGYITNQSRKFHLFVANRVQAIHEASSVEQWRYVPSSQNPADDASRGQTVFNFIKNDRWLSGPKFLLQSSVEWDTGETFAVHSGDVEVKKVKVNATTLKKDLPNEGLKTISEDENDPFQKLFERVSSWYRLKRIIATILTWTYKKKKIDVSVLEKAELAIVRLVQRRAFKTELTCLLANKRKRNLGSLSRLSPFMDEDSIIRVGGRIGKSSSLDWRIKHPIILPKKHPVTELVIRYHHKKVQHGGRDATLNEIRQRGIMIVNASSRVRNEIFKCVTCRKLRGRFGEQRMADLPSERCSEVAPFTYSGVDMFGPFLIKEGRKELKRYGALFTCFSSRAIHLESTNSLETDSFIMALRRFISRRGDVRRLRSDNGTNFVGASAELKKAVKEMDQQKIAEFLLRNNTDWIGWDFNTPTASHMGGVWERQIRSCRSILSSLLNNHSHSLNDECFRTVLTEVEAIVNSRPLSVETINDSDSLIPLTPNLLLTMKSKIVMAPPGEFNENDMYSRRRWRRVQHLVNEFWTRWRTEYLQTLQQRRKWQTQRRNFAVGDIVIIKDDAHQRNEWRLARITDVRSNDDGQVRSVFVQTSTRNAYERPVSKIVLLLESREKEVKGRIPDKEPEEPEEPNPLCI